MLKKCTPLDHDTLKVNTDVAFTEGEIGIYILIRNDLDVLLSAKAVPRYRSFFVDFVELLGIIEGYFLRLPFTGKLHIENNSLVVVDCLTSQFDDF